MQFREQPLNLGVEIYRLVKKLPAEEERVLAEEMMRAVASVATNIALAAEFSSDDERTHCLAEADGKLAALETFILLCVKLNFFADAEAQAALDLCAELRSR